MNRLQKKCLLASSGLHGFALLLLVFGSAFFVAEKKVNPIPHINVIPSKLIDGILAGGGGNPNLPKTDERIQGETLLPQPAPTPPAEKIQPQPAPPTPPAPKPEPPKPEPPPVAKKQPTPKPVEPVKPKVADKAPPVKPRIDLSELTPVTKPDKSRAKAEAEAREAKIAKEAKEAAQRQAAAANTARQRLVQQLNKTDSALKSGFSSGTQVDVFGPGGEAYANYGAWVKAVYDDAWRTPQDLNDDDAVVEVSVTIARDGRVVASRILRRSNSAAMNKSVQRALDAVKQIGQPFPDSSKDSERTFTIEFNLKAKRLLG
jgi:colicin import membrane protein